MLSMSDLLITGDINLSKLSSDLSKYGRLAFPSCLIMAATWENLTSNDFFGLFKATVFAWFLSIYGVGILQTGVETSFSLSDEVIQTYADKSLLLSLFSKESGKGRLEVKDKAKLSDKDIDRLTPKKTSATGGVDGLEPSITWDKLMNVSGQILSSVYAEILFLLAYFSLWLVGLIYTVVYSLLIVFIPFVSAISLFPPLRGAIGGLVTSILWCVLTPILCAGVLCILEQATNISSNSNGVPILSSLEMMLQFLGLTLMILYVPMMATAVISGKGVSSIGDSLGNTAAMGALTFGQGVIVSKFMSSAMAAKDIGSQGAGLVKSFINAPQSDKSKMNTVASAFNSSVKSVNKSDLMASQSPGQNNSSNVKSVQGFQLNEMMKSSVAKNSVSQIGSSAYKDFSLAPGQSYRDAGTSNGRNYRDLSNAWEDKITSMRKESGRKMRPQDITPQNEVSFSRPAPKQLNRQSDGNPKDRSRPLNSRNGAVKSSRSEQTEYKNNFKNSFKNDVTKNTKINLYKGDGYVPDRR